MVYTASSQLQTSNMQRLIKIAWILGQDNNGHHQSSPGPLLTPPLSSKRTKQNFLPPKTRTLDAWAKFYFLKESSKCVVQKNEDANMK